MLEPVKTGGLFCAEKLNTIEPATDPLLLLTVKFTESTASSRRKICDGVVQTRAEEDFTSALEMFS